MPIEKEGNSRRDRRDRWLFVRGRELMASASPSRHLGGETPPRASAWETQNARVLRWLALAMVALGLTWRFARYLLRFPIWGDEAMVLANYFSKGYLDLLGPIDNCQVAPILFHWIELTVMRWLGTSEMAVRLPPFLAGLASVPLFWRLARLSLPPLGRTLAVAIFCVTAWPVVLGATTKPYTFDLLFSLILLNAAVSWLREPERLWPLMLLAAVIPISVAASYPSVFIGGAVSLTLLPVVLRHRTRKVLALFVLYNLLLVGVFVGHYLLVGVSHLASDFEGSTTAQGMRAFWVKGFPPRKPGGFVKWLFLTHTGQMAAYPIWGAKVARSGLTVVPALIALGWLYRERQRGLLLLVGSAFGLGFLAAVLGKYPYGACYRIALHLAPFYCLLAGLGVAVLIQHLGTAKSRWQATLTVSAVLALIGLVGMVRDFITPYRDWSALWAREVTEKLMRRAGDDPVLLTQDLKKFPPALSWNLEKHGARVVSGSEWERRGSEHSVWVFVYGPGQSGEQSSVEGLLARDGDRWRCAERTPLLLLPKRDDEPIETCRIYHWLREESSGASEPSLVWR
jgi:hypothetical protein